MSGPTKAVAYLRSSKDRHDVSIDAQRDELLRVALARNLEIRREFVDVVESAKDEHRPAFQELRAALKARDRDWTVVLLLEPSRLSRNQFVAHWFTHDAKQHGATIVYARMPEANPMVDMIIVPLMHGFAEYHSWESKQKGLAGMAENVKRGFRAGGSAPYGYRLKREPTGAMRDGQEVMKSRLEPDPRTSSAIGEYLRQRAAGAPRRTAKRRSALELHDTTLIGIEWNALTYAGVTVWNVTNERVRGRAVGGVKRRPREQWITKDGTHDALITRDEAERILRRLELGAHARRDRAPAEYLLAGLLQTAAGDAWHGCRDGALRYYRLAAGRRRRVNAETLERNVVDKVARDLRSSRFVQALARAARELSAPNPELAAIERSYADIAALERKIARVTELLAEGPPRPLLEQIRKYEEERERIRAGVIDHETRLRQARAIAGITERDVELLLEGMAEDMTTLNPAELRDFLRDSIGRVVLDEATLSCRIYYEIPAVSGDKMATPRGFEPRLPP